jgi:hypothetical protein
VTGALLLRVWLEGTAEDPQLRIRFVGRQDVTVDDVFVTSVSTVDEAVAWVRDWLEHFQSTASGGSAR